MNLYFPRFLYTVLTCLFLQSCSSGDGGAIGPIGGGGGGACSLGTAANVTVSGQVTFDLVPHTASGALDYDNIMPTPSQRVTVEAVCGTVITTAVTDLNGDYSLSIPGNTDKVFLRVNAEMKSTVTDTASWSFSVVDNTRSQALYTMSGAIFNSGVQNTTRNLHAASGWTGTAYGGIRVAAPFAILNSVNLALQKIIDVDATAVFPALNLNWSINNVAVDGNTNIGQIGTSFYFDTTGTDPNIFILGDASGDADEYDRHVITHEFGHYFEDKFSRSDNIGGFHTNGDILDMRVAFGEGFGNAFSAIATDDTNYSDSSSNVGASFQFDVDDNAACDTNPGWFSECSVQTILYDLYDNTDDSGVDFVSLGFEPIYSVLINEQKNTTALTSIFSFITALKANNVGVSANINTLVAGPVASIDSVADEFGSTETHDAGSADNDVLPIYTDITAGQTIGALSMGQTRGDFCAIDDFIAFFDGEFFNFNRLSNFRFLKFIAPATQSYTITVNTVSGLGVDPDIVLYQGVNGVQDFSDSVDNKLEVLQADFVAGTTYIIQVNDYDVSFSTTLIGDSCFSVSISN